MAVQQNKKRDILWYVGIFLLSVLLYIVVIIVEDAYPFGEKCFLTDDAYVQYNTMLRTLIEYVHSSDRSAILWNRGLGTDMYLTALYYLMSPFNIIALILGIRHVELALIIIIVLKNSLVPVTALYYFRNTKILGNMNKNDIFKPWISFCCSLAWGFCGYMVAYGQNIIWLDAIIMMPLIAICIEKVSEGEAYLKYMILLAFVFIVNFYYAFYVCMFIVVYYLLLDRKTVKEFVMNGLRIAGLSVVSVLISGIVLIPAAMCIMKSGDTSLDSTDTLAMWGDIGHYIVSFFPFKEVTNGYLYNNNNYCGTIAVIMLFIFVISSSVRVKDKLKYGIMVFIFMLSANFLPLNYIMHGFVVPHGTGNRFAIILTFIMLVITYRMLMNIETVKMSAVIFAGIVCSVVFVLAFSDSSRLQVFYSYVVFLFVLAISMILLVLLSRKSIKYHTAIFIITALWVVEICCSMVMTMKDKVNDEDMIKNIHLSEWNDQYQLLDTCGKSRKTAMLNDNYVSNSDVNWYSSMINGYYADAFSSMGFLHFDNVECVYDGATPLTSLMYNVRYVLTNSMNTNGGYHSIYNNDLYSIYEADEVAGWGFMTAEDIMKWKSDGTVGENQSEFTEYGFGKELATEYGKDVVRSDGKTTTKLMEMIPWGDIGHDVAESNGLIRRYLRKDGTDVTESYNAGTFEKVGIGDYIYTGQSSQYHACVLLKFVASKDMDLYVYSADNRDQAVMIFVDGTETAEVRYTSSGQLVYGGHVKKGQNVKISVIGGASVGEKAEKHIQLYSFNTELFDKVKPYITDETLVSDGFSGNTFKGHITAKKDGVLYLAFPYSDGYTMYVDGKRADKLLLGKGNMGVELSAGEHKIRLEYHTPGIVCGIAVSVVGILAFILLCAFEKKRKIAQVSEETPDGKK